LSCCAKKLSSCVKRRVEIMAGLVWKEQERGDIYNGLMHKYDLDDNYDGSENNNSNSLNKLIDVYRLLG